MFSLTQPNHQALAPPPKPFSQEMFSAFEDHGVLGPSFLGDQQRSPSSRASSLTINTKKENALISSHLILRLGDNYLTLSGTKEKLCYPFLLGSDKLAIQMPTDVSLLVFEEPYKAVYSTRALRKSGKFYFPIVSLNIK